MNVTDFDVWGDFKVFFSQPLGHGGMGTVFAGEQISLGRPVAIKVMNRDFSDKPSLVKRFRSEGVTLGQLAAPNIVQIFGAGQEDDKYWFAMELLEGYPLDKVVEAAGKLDATDVVKIGRDVAKGLGAAWNHGIVHRDIKPENLFRTDDGPVKIMDYGIAHRPDSNLTGTADLMGTMHYLSPEVIKGDTVDIRSDIYSLGCVLYYLTSGRLPFDGESAARVMHQHLESKAPTLSDFAPDCPAQLAQVIERCMAKDADDRYPSPDHLLDDLTALRNGRRIHGDTTIISAKMKQDVEGVTYKEPATPVAPATDSSRRGKPIITALLGIILILLMLATLPRVFNPDESRFEQYAELGMQSMAGGRWAEAEALFESALRQIDDQVTPNRVADVTANRDNARWFRYQVQGRRAESSGRLTEAIAAYEQALDIRPDRTLEARLTRLQKNEGEPQ